MAWSLFAGKEPSRPLALPGVNRDTAPSTPIPPGMLERVTGQARSWLGMNEVSGSPQLPFFPPGDPGVASAQGAQGRRMDYANGHNITMRPRGAEPITFELLRSISDPTLGGYDLLRLAIETRKDQMSQLIWSVMPRKQPNQPARPKADDRCQRMEVLFRHPDRSTPWGQWVTQLIEEHLVIDAPAIYRRRDMGGRTIGLELIDGATIQPLLNYDGRRPENGPAYKQILKGVDAVHYTRDDLIYMPRNPRVHKIYGFSCVEQVIVTVNIGLRRQAGQLGFYTEGNVPDAIMQVPPEWSVAQIQEYQDHWDTMLADAIAGNRRKVKFVPAGATLQMTRNESALVDQFDEWLARVIAYCFSLPPTPFVRQNNRATAETAYETSLSEGLAPMMSWMKGIMDYVLAHWLECPDLEFIWDNIKKTDPAEKETRDLALTQRGVISSDDMRLDRGLDAQGVPCIVYGVGPAGFMSVEAIKKVIANGWDLTGIPQPGMGMPGAPGGDMAAIPGGADIGQLGTGGQGDPLANLPPEILAALGLPPPAAPNGGNAPGQPDPNAPALADPNLPESAAPPVNEVSPFASSATPRDAAANVVPIHRHPEVRDAFQRGDRMAHHMAARVRARRNAS